jgi:hypothetical protein
MGSAIDKEATMAITTTNDWRELAQRTGDGLAVTLFWSKSAERIKVAVDDSKTGNQFDLEVAGADALSAFYHPFAFAANRASADDLYHLELTS